MSAWTPSKPKPCHVCGDVDLKAAFGRFNVGTNMYADLAADLQTTLGQLKSSNCPKCQFLTAILHCEDPPRFEMKDMEDSDAICLRKFSIAQLLQDRPASSGTLLGVVPLLPQRQSRPFGWPASDYTGLLATTGFIGRSHAGAEADGESKESPTTAQYRVLQLDTSSVNTDRIKQWLTFCKTSHQDTCSYGHVEQTEIPFFRLIDCTSRSIFTPSSTPEYLALSYVWGSTTPKTVGNGKGILYDVPGVIEDAIQMTLRLGYKYLWIDQFCIYQGDPVKKVQQIAAMDLVYESAQITLIALYDPETGMPGAGRTHRVPQPRLELEDGSAYASTMQNPCYEINASIWMTRGWTFQEGLYSRRRLFFTKHQVFMECHSMTYSEIVKESHEVVEQTDGKPTSFRVFPCRSIESTLSAEPWTIIDRLSKYTDRNLTFESDMVNGILSMFRIFHKSGHGGSRAVTHLWGVPILYSPDKDWTPEYGLVTGLCWRIHGVDPRHGDTPRRSDFPSWSWAGWRAHVWANPEIYRVGFKPPFEIHVAVELLDGSVLALGDYERIVANAGTVGKSGEIPSLSPFLHLEAWTIPVRVLYEPQKSHSWHVVIDQEEEPVTCWLQLHGNDKSNARNASRLHDKMLDAIIVGNIVTREDEQTYNDPWLIVVEKGQVEGTVEKIGFADLDDPLGVGPKTHARYMQHEAPRDMFRELPRLFAGRKRQKLRLA